MRFIAFFTTCLLCFLLVFWLTFGYSLITNIGSVKTEDGYVLHVEQSKLSHIFSQLKQGSDFYFYNSNSDQYNKLEFVANSTVGIYEADGLITVVHPSSFSSYKFEEGELVSASDTTRFGDDPKNVQKFVCSTSIAVDGDVHCFGITPSESGTRILRSVISKGVASQPFLMKEVSVKVAHLEVAYEDGKTLLVWANSENLKEIYYEVVSEGGSFGGLSKYSWAEKWYGYFPHFSDKTPGLLMLRNETHVVDFFSLREERITKEGVFTIDAKEKNLTNFSWDDGIAFSSDGSEVQFMQREGDSFVCIGNPSRIGNARFSPQVVQLLSELVLIILLISFSFVIAVRRRKRASSLTILLPSNLMVRASAFLIDVLILSCISIGIFFLVFLFKGEQMRIALLSQDELKQLQNISVVVMIAYGTIFEWIFLATPGKMLFNITVISTRTLKPSYMSILVRNMMKPVDLLLATFFITPALMIFTPLNQKLGDLLASTLVVDGKKKDVEKVVSSSKETKETKESVESDVEIEIKEKQVDKEDEIDGE